MIALLLRAAFASQAHCVRQSRRSTVAEAARVSLSRLNAFLSRLLGGHQRQALAGFGELEAPVLFQHVAHREVERVADVDGERTVLAINLRRDELGGIPHSSSLRLFGVGAGAASFLGVSDRVTDHEQSAAPASSPVGRPIGAKVSAVPGFTARRMELHLSTATIARQLTEAGIPTTPQAVSSWESPAEAFCPLEHRIDALAEILGVTRTVVEGWFWVEIVGSHR